MKMNCLDSLSCFRIKILLSPDKNPFTFKIVTKVTKFFNIYNRVTMFFGFFHLFYHSALFSRTFRRLLATSALQNPLLHSRYSCAWQWIVSDTVVEK